MAALTFMGLLEQLFQLYNSGAYAQALDLATREGGRFPEHTQRIYHWRMGMASRLNDTVQAIRLFEELIATGSWLPEAWLRIPIWVTIYRLTLNEACAARCGSC